MRLALDPRARRLLRRVPRSTIYSAMELILLSLLAIQCARLIWTIATPVDPVGDWRAVASRAQPTDAGAKLGEFDPFFRLSGDSGPVVVTSLDLTLYGVREDRATGRGSAIIGTPDGEQKSYSVGEEIAPGVVLTAVGFDSVTLSRGGTAERMFLDQSSPATVVSPDDEASPIETMPALSAPPPPDVRSAPPVGAGSIASDVSFEPRLNGREVTGVIVRPSGSGDAFRAAGFAPGDVILSVDGRRIRSFEEARTLADQLSGEREAVVQVERNGRVIPLRVRPGQ